MISASASSHVFQSTSTTTTRPCPTYQTNLLVIWVDSTPHVPTSTSVGASVVTIFHVVYPDGSPVKLQPEIASFLWSGSGGEKQFDNVPVAYTGTPGFYRYTATLTQDIVKATGPGVITIAVVRCSCQDQWGNRGPTGTVSSLITSDTSDNSQEQITSQTTTMTTTTQPIQFFPIEDVIVLIAALLIIAMLLLILRSRRSGKKT
jgi:hypothetical protein